MPSPRARRSSPAPQRSLPSLLLAVLSLAAAPLAAQKSDGPLLGLPHAMFFDGASPVPGFGTIHWQDSGFGALQPALWSPAPPAFPVPDFGTLFGGARDVDALSSGYDWVLALPDGTASTLAGDWGAITFSVTRGTLGAAGSRVAAEVLRPDGAAADVFAYAIPGSALPLDLVGVTFRAQDSAELGAFTPPATANLVAHDLLLALLFRDNPQLVATLPFASVFFSVTAADVPNVPAAWWGAAVPSGAVVLRTDWNGVGWSTPQPFLLPSDLGLLDTEDVDALAVDLLRGRVLFSTARIAGQPVRDPLLFAQVGTPGHSVYRLPAAVPPGGGPPVQRPVSEAIGLVGGLGGPDDIDGICSLDPSHGVGPTGLQLFLYLGTHQAPLGAFPGQLSTSVFRSYDAVAGAERFTSYMTGWPPPGGPLAGFAIAAYRVPASPAPFTTGLFVLRPSGSPFEGHPERFDLHIPAQFSLLGLDVEFLWAAASAQGIDVSEPVRLTL